MSKAYFGCDRIMAAGCNLAKIAIIVTSSMALARLVWPLFSHADLSNRSGGSSRPRSEVRLKSRGAASKFMLLTAEDYDRLVKAAATTRAFHAEDAPEEVAT
jgi:hypothetical protein